MSKAMLVVLALVLCIFATAIVRGGPLELPPIGERIAIALVWIAGIAFMIWTVAKRAG